MTLNDPMAEPGADIGGKPVAVDADESPRPDTSEAALARTRPVFGGPIVTAGNAPIAQALAPLGWSLADLELIEINEAFACVPLTAVRVLAGGDLGLEAELLEKTNVNGGAIAIGHPPGASGA